MFYKDRTVVFENNNFQGISIELFHIQIGYSLYIEQSLFLSYSENK